MRNWEQGRQIFPSIENDELPPNVYTAIEVKGMEFSSVIVCGFGEYFAKEFGDRALTEFLTGTRNLSLKLEYFLNKLYVAVSRSTKVLGIIDTKQGTTLTRISGLLLRSRPKAYRSSILSYLVASSQGRIVRSRATFYADTGIS